MEIPLLGIAQAPGALTAEAAVEQTTGFDLALGLAESAMSLSPPGPEPPPGEIPWGEEVAILGPNAQPQEPDFTPNPTAESNPGSPEVTPAPVPDEFEDTDEAAYDLALERLTQSTGLFAAPTLAPISPTPQLSFTAQPTAAAPLTEVTASDRPKADLPVAEAMVKTTPEAATRVDIPNSVSTRQDERVETAPTPNPMAPTETNPKAERTAPTQPQAPTESVEGEEWVVSIAPAPKVSEPHEPVEQPAPPLEAGKASEPRPSRAATKGVPRVTEEVAQVAKGGDAQVVRDTAVAAAKPEATEQPAQPTTLKVDQGKPAVDQNGGPETKGSSDETPAAAATSAGTSDARESNSESSPDQGKEDPTARIEGADRPTEEQVPVANRTSSTQRVEETRTEGAPRIDRESVVRQISDRVELLAATRAKDGVVVHLEPKDLGRITMLVRMDSGAVDAEIRSANREVCDALENNRQYLGQVLEGRGLSMRNVIVTHESSGFESNQSSFRDSFQGSRQGDAQHSSGNPSSAAPRLAPERPTAVVTLPNSRTAAGSGAVDLWI